MLIDTILGPLESAAEAAVAFPVARAQEMLVALAVVVAVTRGRGQRCAGGPPRRVMELYSLS
jgi:hypothetical protein